MRQQEQYDEEEQHFEDGDEEVDQEEVINVILSLGNDILKHLKVEETIDDVGVFFSDAFYIQFFQAAFPEIDFSQLEEATNEEEMAQNIQALIDLLGQQILKYDLSHIKGEEIVNGQPEHCINLLQLVQEIAVMLHNKEDGDGEGDDEEEEDVQKQPLKLHQESEEDDEAEIIHEKKRKEQSEGKRGRSFSESKGGKAGPQFDMDDFEEEISNDFNDQMDDGGDDDDDEELQLMMNGGHKSGQKQQIIDDPIGDDEDIDEDDLKMYEQFLANDQEQNHSSGKANKKAPPPPLEDEEDDEDIDLDNVDYDQLDPQILEIADQMGVHPKEVLKQIMQMQNQEEGNDYDDEEAEDQDEDEEVQMIEQQLKEEEILRKEKEAFKQKMGLSSEKKPQPKSEDKTRQSEAKPRQSETKPRQSETKPQYQEPVYQQQQQQQYLQNYDYDDEDDQDDEDSYYSEGEIKTRIKLLSQKSYSAPYIIINDCFDEPLYDSESQILQKACSTTMLQSLELQQQQQQQEMNQEEDELDEQTAQLLFQQQQKMQQKANQQSKITEVSKSKESSSYNQHKKHYPQLEEEDQEMDIDISKKLKDLQNQQNQEDGDEQDEEEDDEMLIDLDQLDDHNKQMLLEYLQQEYDKNPDQFPFPKELIEDYMLKQQSKDQESVKDIKSEEMIVEDANYQITDQIEGGEQEIEENQEDPDNEEEEELSPEEQEQLQQYLMMQQQQQMMQQQQQQQDYGEEVSEEQPMPQQQFQQTKPKSTKMRPQSGNRTKKVAPKGKQQEQIQLYTHIEQIPQDQLQLIVQLLQEQQIDIENVDPNILQQLIIAQAQQLQQMALAERTATSTRTTTAKRKSSGSKKRKSVKNIGLTKVNPYQMPKSMKVLMPSTPGSQMRSFGTHRSKPFSAKKTKKKVVKKGIKIPNQQFYPNHQQQYIQEEQMQQPQQLVDIPNLSEDFLNQLSEEQLEQLLQHQQQLMMMQQQQVDNQQLQQKSLKKTRPKSVKRPPVVNKGPKIPQTYSNYYQPQLRNKKPVTKGKKKKIVKKNVMQYPINQGVMLNHYFPALESGNALIGNSQTDEQSSKDQRYPKFGTDHINNPPILQDAIDEVPADQEEGESQEIINRQPDYYQQSNDMDDNQDSAQDQDVMGHQDVEDQDQADPNTEEGDQIQFSDEQLIELIQNAHNLTPDQQAQLQMILQQRMKMDMANERAQSYQNIYHILMDNVKKAKDRLAPLGQVAQRIDEVEETDQRILRQKQEFEALYRLYNNEVKNRETKKRFEDQKLEKKLQREAKIQAIKERKFQEELLQHQKSLNYKRNAQQVKLCQKVYKLASELEKNKLLAEKKEYKETQQRKKVQNKLMVDAIETYYRNQISMLKERIGNERFERKIAQQAQSSALAKMKRELNDQKKREVDKYLQMLRQEDQKYDFESTQGNRLEHEIVKMYKK